MTCKSTSEALKIQIFTGEWRKYFVMRIFEAHAYSKGFPQIYEKVAGVTH